MKLKKVKGTLRHSFDVAVVQRHLEQGKLDGDDAKRILGEALHVIGGLRHDVRTLQGAIRTAHDASQWAKESIWY